MTFALYNFKAEYLFNNSFIYCTDCYPLFLLKCPQQPHRTGHYILCFNDSKLNVYSTHNGQRVWTWKVGHLRRFSYEPKIPYVEIEPGRLVVARVHNMYSRTLGSS